MYVNVFSVLSSNLIDLSNQNDCADGSFRRSRYREIYESRMLYHETTSEDFMINVKCKDLIINY